MRIIQPLISGFFKKTIISGCLFWIKIFKQIKYFISVRYSNGAVRYGMVWYGTARCGVVRCGAVRCDAVWCGVVWCSAVWCNAVWCGVV